MSLIGCSTLAGSHDIDKNSDINNLYNNSNLSKEFAESGTITISYPVVYSKENGNEQLSLKGVEKNSESENISANNNAGKSTKLSHNNNQDMKYAPVIGFTPVHATFQPADNEIWIELERESTMIRIFKGKEKIKEIKGEGKISLAPGEYPLQHKQKSPLWYAPDEYFEKRQLRVPPRGDHFRYRRGALGSFALYPTMDFIIHSGPFWSDEIGGLKLSETDLSSIFSIVNVGAAIVVK